MTSLTLSHRERAVAHLAHDRLAWVIVTDDQRIGGWRLSNLRTQGKLDLGCGVVIAASIRCDARREGWCFVARLRLRNLLTGSLVERLELIADDGHSVEPEDLRRVPLDELESVVQDAAFQGDGLRFDRAILVRNARGDDRPAAAATYYRLARIMGHPPTASVAENLSVSLATAGRLIRQARDRGLLGEAIGTVAGERREQ